MDEIDWPFRHIATHFIWMAFILLQLPYLNSRSDCLLPRLEDMSHLKSGIGIMVIPSLFIPLQRDIHPDM